MRVLITGGTGLIGQALCRKLTEYGAQVTVLSRQPERVPELCANARGIATLQEITSADAVINLAGAPIADRPWTKARRALLWQSRVDATHALITWIQQLKQRPSVLVSASATGWYGDCEGRIVNENSAQQSEDFASRLCDAWEKLWVGDISKKKIMLKRVNIYGLHLIV